MAQSKTQTQTQARYRPSITNRVPLASAGSIDPNPSLAVVPARKLPSEINASPLELAILLAAREQLGQYTIAPDYFDLRISVTPEKVRVTMDSMVQVVIDRAEYTVVIQHVKQPDCNNL